MLECEALHGVPAGVHQQLGGGPGVPEVPHQQDPGWGAPAAVALSQNTPLSIIDIASHRESGLPLTSLIELVPTWRLLRRLWDWVHSPEEKVRQF